MHASDRSWSRPPAIAVGVVATILVGVTWEFVWYWLYALVGFLTWGLCPRGITCEIIFACIYFLGAGIPIAGLLFLARSIVLNLTKDAAAARQAFLITLALDLAAGLAVGLLDFWTTSTR